MSEDRVKAEATEGFGRLQDAIGGLMGDGATQAKEKLNDAVGAAQDAYGKVKDRAHDALDEAGSRAQDIYGDVEGFVRDKPLQALAIGVGVGLGLGLMLLTRRKMPDLRRLERSVGSGSNQPHRH